MFNTNLRNSSDFGLSGLDFDGCWSRDLRLGYRRSRRVLLRSSLLLLLEQSSADGTSNILLDLSAFFEELRVVEFMLFAR